MPTCPHCNKEIDHLEGYSTEIVKYYVTVSKDGLNHDYQEFVDDLDNPSYHCPECGEMLFKTDEEAETFLKS